MMIPCGDINDVNEFSIFVSFCFVLDSVLPPFGGRDDAMSEERIAHILNEASTLMKNSTPSALQHQLKDEQQHQHQHQHQHQQQHLRHSVSSLQEDSRSNEDFKSPPLHSCSSPLYKDQAKPASSDTSNQVQTNSSHLRSEDINPEKMARLYQEIMARAPREAFSK